VPYVLIQLLMVALVIAFPELVTWDLDAGPGVDAGEITIPVPEDADLEQYWPEGTEVPQ
jgi:hypothetical protein